MISGIKKILGRESIEKFYLKSIFVFINKVYFASKKESPYNPNLFVDRVRLNLEGGKGGMGCYSFIRTRVIKTGHPDGGNGGDGGDIIIESQSSKENNLYYIKDNLIKGNEGYHGKSNNKNGDKGNSITIGVPLGTSVFKITKEKDDNILKEKRISLIDSMNKSNQKLIVCKGGSGGLGTTNKNFKPSLQSGKVGQKVCLELELSILNEISILGFSNSGKTSLINYLSLNVDAINKEKQSPTKYPSLHFIKYINNDKISVMDLPSLINISDEDNIIINSIHIDPLIRHINNSKILLIIINGTESNYKDQIIEILVYIKKQKLNNKKIIFGISHKDLLDLNKISEIESYMIKLKAPYFIYSIREVKDIESFALMINTYLSKIN